jgi:hypothetical protein
MAKKVEVKKKKSAPAPVAVDKASKKGSPVVIYLPRSLKGMAKLAAIASGNSLSDAFRKFLKEVYIPENKKAIAKLVSDTSKVSDDDEDETEDTEVEDDAEVEEDEDAEEEEDEEDEDEDE